MNFSILHKAAVEGIDQQPFSAQVYCNRPEKKIQFARREHRKQALSQSSHGKLRPDDLL